MYFIVAMEHTSQGDPPTLRPIFSLRETFDYQLSNSVKITVCTVEKDNFVSQQSRSVSKLFVDDVWPGSIVIADYLKLNPHLCAGKTVLELGAGAALPSCVCCKLQACKVVVSDFPDSSILENCKEVLQLNEINGNAAVVIGHQWGTSVSPLLQQIDILETRRFDLIIMAELLWKDTYEYQNKLLQSLVNCLDNAEGIALLSFVHRPTPDMSHTSEKDLEFISSAEKEYGLTCTLLGSYPSEKSVDEKEGQIANVLLYSLKFCQP